MCRRVAEGAAAPGQADFVWGPEYGTVEERDLKEMRSWEGGGGIGRSWPGLSNVDKHLSRPFRPARVDGRGRGRLGCL